MATFSEKQLFDRLWQAFTTDGSGNVCLRTIAAGTLSADAVKDTMIDWGTGADQVSAVDMPIADAGAYFSTDNVEAALQQLGADVLAAGAPKDATYIVQTASGVLTNEQALGSLTTGLLKNTAVSGILSIATAGTDYYNPGGTDVAVADGGTGASDASGARTNLGLVIGTHVQAYDADLAALAAISSAGILARTGAGTAAARTLTGTASRLTISNGDGASGNPTFDIASDYVGQNTITTLGTISTGVWSGTIITVAKGGTGVASLTGLVKGNGASNMSAAVEGTDYWAPGGTDVALLDGGTGASTASGARSNLGAAASGVNTDITGLTGLNTQAAVVIGPFNTGAGQTGELRFKELAAGGSNYVGFKAPDALGGDVIFTLPDADGSAGQYMKTNGSKVLSWGTPGDTQIRLDVSNMFPDATLPCTAAANTAFAGTITYDNSATGTSGTTAFTVGSGTNRALVVIAGCKDNTGSFSGCTYNGVAMTQLAQNTDNGRTTVIYYLANPASGSNNIVISYSTGGTLQWAAGAYAGVNQLNPVEVALNGYAGSGTTTVLSGTSTGAGEWIVGAAFPSLNSSGHTASAGSGCTIRVGSGTTIAWGDSNSGFSAGSNSITFNISGNAAHWGRGCYLIPDSYPTVRALSFANGSAQCAMACVMLPAAYAGGTMTAKFIWSSTSGTGDAYWSIQAMSAPDNTSHSTAFGTAVNVADTSNGADKTNISAATSAMTIGGTPAAGQPCWFRITRKSNDSTNDTLGAAARLIGVILSF